MDRIIYLDNVDRVTPFLDLHSPLNYNPNNRVFSNYIFGCTLHPEHRPIFNSTPVYMIEQFDPYHFNTYGRQRHSRR